MKKSSFAATVALALVLAGCSGNGPDENIALNKAAYASSTYDYNLTAPFLNMSGDARVLLRPVSGSGDMSSIRNLALNGQFLAALQAPVRISVRSDSSEDPGCRDRRAIPR